MQYVLRWSLWKEVRSAMPSAAIPKLHQLVLAAAQLRYGLHEPAEKAVECVLRHYSEAVNVFHCEQKLADSFVNHVQLPVEATRRPQKWPAPFADFLTHVVCGKDCRENFKRFRQYIEHNIQNQR